MRLTDPAVACLNVSTANISPNVAGARANVPIVTLCHADLASLLSHCPMGAVNFSPNFDDAILLIFAYGPFMLCRSLKPVSLPNV